MKTLNQIAEEVLYDSGDANGYYYAYMHGVPEIQSTEDFIEELRKEAYFGGIWTFSPNEPLDPIEGHDWHKEYPEFWIGFIDGIHRYLDA